LSIARQCDLLGISRASFFYEAKGESLLNLEIMRLIDEQFLEMPWYGSRQMARWLRRQRHGMGMKRVVRLMRKMGLTPVYPKPNTSKPHPEHRVYPQKFLSFADELDSGGAAGYLLIRFVPRPTC